MVTEEQFMKAVAVITEFNTQIIKDMKAMNKRFKISETETISNPDLLIPLCQCDVSKRLYNSITQYILKQTDAQLTSENMQLVTLGDICKLTPRELKRILGIGLNSRCELYNLLDSKKLTLS